MNFKNLDKCDILKMRKQSTLIKVLSVSCLLKSSRAVYYHVHLNLIKDKIETIFSLKKSIFAF